MNDKQNYEDLGLEITDAALAYFEKLLAKEEANTNIRIHVSNPGTIVADIKVTYCPCTCEQNTDVAVKFGALIVFIEKISLPYLKDAKIDFLAEEQEDQLSIKAPHLKTNIDENKPLAEKIQLVIDNEINPILASHGGMIALEDVIDDSIVLLRFGGGCHGCKMANITFQNTVKSMLKHYFPELEDVRNVTDYIEDVS